MLGIFLAGLGALWLLGLMVRWMVRAAVHEEVRSALPVYLGQDIPEEPPYMRWEGQARALDQAADALDQAAEALEEVDGFELEDEDEPWKRGTA